jgi:hypothetical protein
VTPERDPAPDIDDEQGASLLLRSSPTAFVEILRLLYLKLRFSVSPR